MKDHCTTLVKDSRFLFTCPSCRRSWDYFLVRHVLSAAMTDDDLESFNRKVNANLMNSCIKNQRCPGCKIFLQRDSSKIFSNPNWVQCPVCSAKNGKRFEFCWVCLKPWKGDKNSCGNDQCTGKDTRIQILKTCKTKAIGPTRDVPNTRCCARCGNLINHTDMCKHMSCPKCHYEFCFVCLKPKTSTGWQCGEYDSSCNVAPRQTKVFDLDTDNVSEGSISAVQTYRHHTNDASFGIIQGIPEEKSSRRRSILTGETRPRSKETTV